MPTHSSHEKMGRGLPGRRCATRSPRSRATSARGGATSGSKGAPPRSAWDCRNLSTRISATPLGESGSDKPLEEAVRVNHGELENLPDFRPQLVGRHGLFHPLIRRAPLGGGRWGQRTSSWATRNNSSSRTRKAPASRWKTSRVALRTPRSTCWPKLPSGAFPAASRGSPPGRAGNESGCLAPHRW